MAKTSFTVRKEETGLAGSYLQFPPTYDTTSSAGSYINLPGSSVNDNVSTPSIAAYNISGDIEVEIDLAFTTLAPASDTYLLARGNADPNRSWAISLTSGGLLKLRWYPTGSAASLIVATSSVSLASVGIVAGQRVTVKMTLDVDNGASGNDVKFWYSTNNGATFTQLGSTVTTAGVTSLPTVTANLVFNTSLGGTNLNAKLYRGIVRNGIGGTAVFNVDFTTGITSQGQTVVGANTGQAVTINGTASAVYLLNRTARTTDDSYLRADGFQTPPLLALLGEFTVRPVDYNLTYLTWGVPLTSTLTATPQATQVILVYSPDGEPDTVDSGSVLLETTTDGEYYHVCPEGRWAYYTLFLKYQSSTGDLYYDAAAKLSVLVPKNYGSTDILYNHIPTYYREQDSQLDEGSGGPLYRYLSIFGWDADRLRTLVDYFIGCRDPQVARTEELDHIASEFGVPFTSTALGASRLRAYLNEVGTTSRGNGRETILEAALSAVTGSEVIVNYATSTIYVKPQRVNLIRDPMLKTGLSTAFDGGLPTTTTFGSVVDFGGVTLSGPITPYDGGAYDTVYSSASGYWSAYNDATQSGVTILEGVSATIKVAAGKVFYFSVDINAQDYVLKVGLCDTTVSPRTYIASDTIPTVVGGRKYWKIEVPTNYSGTPSTAALRVEYTTSTTEPTALFKNVLLEENNFGLYFDGSTARGGWVTGAGGNISDFRWYDPANPNAAQTAIADNAFSVYSANFQKTKSVVTRILPELLPVNQLVTSGTVYSNRDIATKWTVVYNYMPDYP